MEFRVIEDFTDLQDKRHEYKKGMTYPRKGYVPSEKRISELVNSKNKLGRAVIEPILVEKIKVTEPEEVIYVDKTAKISEEAVNEEKPRRRRRKE